MYNIIHWKKCNVYTFRRFFLSTTTYTNKLKHAPTQLLRVSSALFLQSAQTGAFANGGKSSRTEWGEYGKWTHTHTYVCIHPHTFVYKYKRSCTHRINTNLITAVMSKVGWKTLRRHVTAAQMVSRKYRTTPDTRSDVFSSLSHPSIPHLSSSPSLSVLYIILMPLLRGGGYHILRAALSDSLRNSYSLMMQLKFSTCLLEGLCGISPLRCFGGVDRILNWSIL